MPARQSFGIWKVTANQPLFISYANLSLRNGPKAFGILRFLYILKRQFPFQLPPYFYEIIRHIFYFASLPNIHFAQTALTCLKNNLLIRDTDLPGGLDIAFEAIYGYQDHYCMNFKGEPLKWFDSLCALYSPGRHALIEAELFQGPDDRPGRLKCFECEQLYLKGVLDQIIEGKEFSEIFGLREFLQCAVNYQQGNIAVADRKIAINNFWGGLITLAPQIRYEEGPDRDYPYKHVFNEFVRSIIAYSLGDTLFNDSKEIKRCSYCDKYFLKIRRKDDLNFCRDKCRYAYHNKEKIESGYFKDLKKRKGYYKY